jgi:hypothetical protein
MSEDITKTLCRSIRGGILLAGFATAFLHAEPNSTLTGRVIDPSYRVVPGAEIVVRNLATLVERSVTSNAEGIYEILALQVGVYRMQVRAPGFRPHIVDALTTDVARMLVQDVRLELRDISQEIIVTNAPLIDRATTSVRHPIDDRIVQEVPLNGRYFLDLVLLAPWSVAPSNGFSSRQVQLGIKLII